jgi:hypothetical protein
MATYITKEIKGFAETLMPSPTLRGLRLLEVNLKRLF